MLFPRKAYKHQMPAWVWIRTLHGCPPHHVLTNLSLSMYHKQPRRIDWYGLDTKKKIIFANVSYKSTVLNLEKAGFGVNGFEPHKLVMSGSNSVLPVSACKRAWWTPSRSFLRLLWVDEEARGRPAARSANFLHEKLSSAWIVSEHRHNFPPSTAL